MLVHVVVDVLGVVVFVVDVVVVVVVVVQLRLEDAGGRQEAELGAEAFEGRVRVGVELDEEHGRRGPQFDVVAQSAQVGDDRRFALGSVVHFQPVAAR